MIGTKEEIVLWLMNQPNEKKFEIKEYKEHRSLNANSYFWVLVGKIAQVTKSTNAEVHNVLLQRYGQIETVDGVAQWVVYPESYTPNDHEYLMPTPNRVRLQTKKGECIGIVYIRLRGSRTYNTAEMSRLIDGTIADAKDLGIIDVLPNNRVWELIQKWQPQPK